MERERGQRQRGTQRKNKKRRKREREVKHQEIQRNSERRRQTLRDRNKQRHTERGSQKSKEAEGDTGETQRTAEQERCGDGDAYSQGQGRTPRMRDKGLILPKENARKHWEVRA